MNYTQASKLLAQGRDSGLPAVVAKVNGWGTTGREVAQMEAVLTTRNTPIGSSALRRAVFQAILDQYVQIQAAIKQRLLPFLSWARSGSQSGHPGHRPNSCGHPRSAAMVLYQSHVLGSQNASNTSAMRRLAANLIQHATIPLFFHF